MYSYEPPHMAEQKQDDTLEHTYSSSVRIRDVALNSCLRRWTIERSGERGPGISVQAARHDDDDEKYYRFTRKKVCDTTVIVLRNRDDEASSNPGRSFLCFPLGLGAGQEYKNIAAMGK